MAASNGGQVEPDGPASWKRRWLIDLVQAVLLALGLFVAVVLVLVFLYNSVPHGELGTSRQDYFAENVRVTADNPLGVRLLSARVDPADSVLDSISVYLNLQTNRSREEMWLGALRLDDAGTASVTETSANVFREAFPGRCLRLACEQMYLLVACWRQPTTDDEATIYFGGNLSAERRSGTPPGRVVLDVMSDRVPVDIADTIAAASGCEAVR